MKNESTPRPWRSNGSIEKIGEYPNGTLKWMEIIGDNDSVVTAMCPGHHSESVANSELIIRAVNSHDALIGIAKGYLAGLDQAEIEKESQDEQNAIANTIRDIIKQAEGK